MKAPRRQGELPILPEGVREPAIIPLASNATALHWHRLAPGPEFAAARPEQAPATETPSARERALRGRIAQLVAAQVLEDAGDLRIPRGGVAHHAYAAALKRIMGKGRAEMSLAELEATLAWLERNRIGDHLKVLEGDARYGWTVRQRRFDFRSGP